MKRKLLMLFLGTLLLAAQAIAQQVTVTGKVTSAGDGLAIPGASVKIKGTTSAVGTTPAGIYTIRVNKGQVLVFSYLGYAEVERTVGDNNVINVILSEDSKSLNEVVITALGREANKKSLGTSQQSVAGRDVADTQRENFVNALSGRVAGLDVTSSSGVPGASSSITIRGVSSISGSNQPLFIVDGLPIDNKTTNTSAFFSDNSANTSISNRGVDFTNRIADINPEDIESLVVLKGPEAAALYGIDAANGAIVIKTRRGKSGTGVINYGNSFRIDQPTGKPEIQQTFGLGTSGTPTSSALTYFGPAYAPGQVMYNNIDGFFRTAFTQKHNLSLEGGSDNVNYRFSGAYTGQEGVIPNSKLDKINLTGASTATVNKWLKADLSLNYSFADNTQPLKGANGPLLSLLTWPQTDDAKNYLTPAGTRRKITTAASTTELDNPYFSIYKNILQAKTNRIFSNLGFTVTPTKWLRFNSNIGLDTYTNQNMVLRHPETATGFTLNGIIDVSNDIVRNTNVQSYFSLVRQNLGKDFTVEGLIGNAIKDERSNIDASYGENFLDPDFISINNTKARQAKTIITRRRLFSFFGQATFGYKDYAFLTVTGRNDWTSTIPQESYSFFYPSVSGSFVFTDVPAFEGLKKIFTYGKFRAAYAEVGKDARPYSVNPALEFKTTTNGGFGYGFTGPNPNLKPEFAKSYEFGTEMAFFENRLGIDFTYYKKETKDQIVNDIRGSYATGYVLFNLNGASTRNTGIEATLRGTPVKHTNFSWDVTANFDRSRGTVIKLPNALPESYVSDTWLYANVRNGATPGHSTLSLTGLFYLRNNKGELLISPATGLPVRSTTFIDAGYDRQPDFTLGLTNKFNYKNLSFSFLVDFRKGGDILNATDHYLTLRGLTDQTLDRFTPRIISGVFQDGRENSATPTRNNIVLTPYFENSYYSSMSEELFIEKDINWVRLRELTVKYRLPEKLLKRQGFVKNASIFLTGTDLFLITNYSGADPIVNGNSAAVGGSGGRGIDLGNFAIPRGINLGINVGF